ncbi:endo-1,4-beta-xylanase [Thalassobellus sediminis]|uniref:endo-1,4-beta-xylanase n=1 Tax=Thalassobellus sediminis TaxID=3367753 RepID=UPI0037AF0FAC
MSEILKYITLIVLLAFMSCSKSEDDDTISTPEPTPAPMPTITLKEAANFPIGNTVSESTLASSSNNYFRTLLNKEFNSITAGNDMKMYKFFKGPNNYDWSSGDAIVTYAKANGLRVHGHTLIWHPSYAIPDWLENFGGTDAEFEAHIEAYIKAAVSHFAEATFADGTPVLESWDVVNEAFTSDAEAAPFHKRIGPDYVEKCFKWAREADDKVKLFYNDYNLGSDSSKAGKVINMVNDFKANSVPIDGIGMQMHIDYQYPGLQSLKSNVTKLANTGLLIHFSEVDMTVNKDKVLTRLTTERSNAQKERYKQMAIIYKTIPEAQQFGITFWGMRDTDSWLLDFYDNPKEWPLLFDSGYNYKPAIFGFLDGLTN